MRRLGSAAVEHLTLPKAEHMHEFNNVEEVAETLDRVYCLPKVGEGQEVSSN